MSEELIQLREQVRTQEMDILRLRAICAERDGRIANLERIVSTLTYSLDAARRQAKRQAEAVFRQ